MSFDEKYFSSLLTQIDGTSVKIKQISNYMTFFREMYLDKILSLWKANYLSSPAETKLLLIYAASEAILQTQRKGKIEYIKGIGDSLIELVNDMCKNTSSPDILIGMIKLCDFWENNLIYRRNIMEVLRNILQSRLKQIERGDDMIQSAIKIKKDLSLISKHEICKRHLELDIEEDNIKRIYEGLDKDRFNKILDLSDYRNYNKHALNEYEEKLKELKSLIISDLIKRENLILSYADIIEREKKLHFNTNNEDPVI